MSQSSKGRVVSVSLSAKHGFSKTSVETIRLLAGLGVEGDAHCGTLVKHRYKVKQDPTQPNLCQVHLLQAELLDELASKGFEVLPGEMGENVTTRGIDLLALPTGATLRLGADAVVKVTGLRSPCVLIDRFKAGLLPAVVGKDAAGRVIRKAGIMGIAIVGGVIAPGDAIEVTLPEKPWREMMCV